MQTAQQEDGTAPERTATENGALPKASTISASDAHNRYFQRFLLTVK